LDPTARREQILEHAAALFGRKGYHGTSISNIIQSAGIARGTFYLYFENKRAIFEELLDYLVIQIGKRIRTVDLGPDSPSARDQLVGNITRVIELLGDNHALLSILLEGAVGLDKGFADKLGKFYEQIADALETSLKRGQEMGLVRECNTRIVALSTVGGLKEVLHGLLRDDGRATDINEIAEEILDVYSRGVIPEGVSIR
jgi:AcrR family transcriptional regulator